MAFYRNPIVAAGPYVDSPGPESPTETAPDEMQAFYDDMERREILERKLSQRRSNSGTSVWSRKSLKRWTITPPVPSSQADLPRAPSNANLQDENDDDEVGYGSEHQERGDIPRLATSRSVIADNREFPASADSGAWAAVPLPAFKVKYPLHNPFGPRRYRNHHLIPPSQKRPSMRPPTFFSPSFPPMHTSSAPEHFDDRPESTNTNNNSPMPTPTSSQTRVGEGGKPRSRKTSQTAPDNVDLLDVTDPWGTNWHHQSPYDINTPASSDAYDIPNRTRRASMTAMQGRNKSVAPSPLSQSTSAVHLQPPQPEIHIPRKLSKRRIPTAENVFAPQPPEIDRNATSAPVAPVERRYVAPSQGDQPSESLPKRMSVVPAPVYSTLHQTPKKEKRGSMLNRLARKFSLLRKPSEDVARASDWWHHIDSHETKGYTNAYDTTFDKGRTSPQKSVRDSVKRVPPPSVDNLPDPPPPPPAAAVVETVQNSDRLSVASLETPYSMGRLTITNPDLLSDTDKGTPMHSEPPLPPEKPKDIHIQPHVAVENVLSQSSPTSQLHAHTNGAASSDIRLRFDKPLPPPQLGTPEISQLRLSDVRNAQALEQQLPLPSRANSPVANHASLSPENHDLLGKEKQDTQKPLANHNTGENPNANASNRSQVMSPGPILTQELQETPKKSSSHSKDKSSPTKDTPMQSETATPDRSRTVPPPVSPENKKETPKKTLSQSHPSRNADASTSRNRVLERSPQVTPPSHSEAYDRSGEASTSTLQPSKPSGSHSRSESTPAPAAGAVPFPTSKYLAANSMMPEYESSPLSASSMLANPPTPYDHRVSIAFSDQPPTLPPKSIYEGKSPQNHSPTNPSPSRQTETFKLVRSSSGNVYASNQTITAAGQQWEVVESVEVKAKKDKSSSKAKDQEYKSRDQDYRGRDHDYRSRDYERRSKDYDYRARDERRSRDYDRWSRDHDKVRDEYKYRDDPRTRDERRSREEHRPREEQRAREAREEQLAKEERRVREAREERAREEQRIRDKEEQRGREREERRSREAREERAREEYRLKEEQRIRDEWKAKEEQRAREERRAREEKRAKEERRAREREEQKAREWEEQKAREWEEQKAREREEQKAREREEQKAREREEQKAREREEQKAREREEQKVREREEQKARDQQRAKEEERASKEEWRRKDHERRSKDDYRSRDFDQRPNDREYRSNDYDRRSNDFDLTTRDYEFKSKDYDHSSRRETKKEPKSKHDIDDADYYQSSHRSFQQPVQYPAESSNSRSNGKIASHHREERSRHEEKKSSRKRDDYHERDVERRLVVSDSSSSSDYYGTVIRPDPINIPPQPSNPLQPRLERNPSLTARPTSELPSAAEMSAVRAKESWEMERLWKARSMYGFEPNAQTTDFIPGSSSSSSRSDDVHTQSAVYGSSHTAYVVHTPFQGSLGAQIYHSMPTGPPPIIYSSPSSIPSIPDNLSSYEPYEHVYRSFAAATPSDYRSPATIPRPPSDYRSPATIPRPPLNNPLPEPPRESQLELNGLKNTKSSDRHSHSNDYWTKYNGITTTH